MSINEKGGSEYSSPFMAHQSRILRVWGIAAHPGLTWATILNALRLLSSPVVKV